jgi:23S rRNA (guanosine2251-2'-O)-methyltransferase
MEHDKKSQAQHKPQNTLLFGKHACAAALANPKRKCKRIYVTDRVAKEMHFNPKHPTPKIINIRDFDKLLPREAVHQGIAIEVDPLPEVDIKTLSLGSSVLVILDQVTDPHNVGAILRSCAAFNVGGIIAPKDNAPTESGTMAKSASGALEIVPICRVTNLVRAMEQLKKDGYWIAGLDGNTDTNIDKAKLSGKIAIVMGAEGAGLRKLTRDNCDILVRLPISNKVESLNVSNAAAIALYEIGRNNG